MPASSYADSLRSELAMAVLSRTVRPLSRHGFAPRPKFSAMSLLTSPPR